MAGTVRIHKTTTYLRINTGQGHRSRRLESRGGWQTQHRQLAITWEEMRFTHPLLLINSTSSSTDVPPIKRPRDRPVMSFRNSLTTSWICDASSRVGEIIMDATWPQERSKCDVGYYSNHLARSKDIILLTSCFWNGSFRRSSVSKTGMTNAKVLPLPVTASTATSLFRERRGIQAT